MKFIIAISSALLLSACSLWPSYFDQNEHARMVDIAITSKDASVCDNYNTAKTTVVNIVRDTNWLIVYGNSLPDNDSLIEAYSNLEAIVPDFGKRYVDPANPPSAAYCKLKLKNINEATQTLIEVSGRRPRA